jgi:hypothetical protein
MPRTASAVFVSYSHQDNLGLQQGDAVAARGHVAEARKLVNETGYRRREREVAWLERRLGVTGTPP